MLRPGAAGLAIRQLRFKSFVEQPAVFAFQCPALPGGRLGRAPGGRRNPGLQRKSKLAVFQVTRKEFQRLRAKS